MALIGCYRNGLFPSSSCEATTVGQPRRSQWATLWLAALARSSSMNVEATRLEVASLLVAATSSTGPCPSTRRPAIRKKRRTIMAKAKHYASTEHRARAARLLWAASRA
jgi:hypothetical protein